MTTSLQNCPKKVDTRQDELATRKEKLERLLVQFREAKAAIHRTVADIPELSLCSQRQHNILQVTKLTEAVGLLNKLIWYVLFGFSKYKCKHDNKGNSDDYVHISNDHRDCEVAFAIYDWPSGL